MIKTNLWEVLWTGPQIQCFTLLISRRRMVQRFTTITKTSQCLSQVPNTPEMQGDYFSKNIFYGCCENQSQTVITQDHKAQLLTKSELFKHKYKWAFVNVPIKLRKVVLCLKHSGLWKVIPGFRARCLFFFFHTCQHSPINSQTESPYSGRPSFIVCQNGIISLF